VVVFCYFFFEKLLKLFVTLINNNSTRPAFATLATMLKRGSDATRPLFEGRGRLRTINSRATPQGLDQRSTMEEVVPKMARRRGSIRPTFSFICQGTSTWRQRRNLFGLSSQAATCYYQFNPSKVEAI